MSDLEHIRESIPRVLRPHETPQQATERRRIADELRALTPPPPQWTPNQAWAAIMLAVNADTCTSLFAGKPVRAGNLHAHVLRDALRSRALPPAGDYIVVTAEMLDSINEASTQ